MTEEIETGTVVSWVADRGFGFIRPDLGGADLFLHYAELDGGQVPIKGDRVRYESRMTYRGLRALRVRRVLGVAA